MEAPVHSRRVLRFGKFEIDLQSAELYKHGTRIRLQEQPFQILSLLLERPGEMVTREDLRRKLWPKDTFVDFDDGLNAAIGRLRSALNDSATRPRFVETLPRHGYRFIAPVADVTAAGQEPEVFGSEARLPLPSDGEWKTGTPLSTSAKATDTSFSHEKEQNPTQVRSFRNRNKFLRLAGSLALILVAAAATIYSGQRSALFTDRDSILLADFVNTTGDEVFDVALKRALSVELEQSPYLNVISEQQIRQSLRFMGRSSDERITNEVAREICQRNAIKAMLTASITNIGEKYLITLAVVDADSSSILVRESGTAKDKNDVLDTLSKVATRLRASLGESLVSIQAFNKPLTEATTASLEALKALSLGDSLHSRGEELASVPYFLHAVELDRNFAIAYARLGNAYWNLGQQDKAEYYRKEAFERRNRTSERENFYITAHYYFDNGELEKGIEVYEVWKRTYPRDFIPSNNLSASYIGLGHFNSAVMNGLDAVRLNPDAINGYVETARAYTGLGRLDETKAVLNAAQQRGLDGWLLHDLLFRIAVNEHDLEAEERERRLIQKNPEGDLHLLFFEANRAAARGQLHRSQELFLQARDTAARLNLKELAAIALIARSIVSSQLGNPATINSDVGTAMKISKSPNVLLGAAQVFALTNEREKVRSLIEKVRNERPNDQFVNDVSIPMILGTMRIVGHDPNGAIELLKPSASFVQGDPGALFVRGVAFLQAKKGSEAEQEFKKMLALRSLYLDVPLDPLTRFVDDSQFSLAELGLALAYALQNRIKESRTTYQDFLATWKDADPDVRLAQIAQKEYEDMGRCASPNC